MSYKLAIIGSRGFSDYDKLCEEMAKLPKPALIVSGGARGADSLGKKYADEHGIPTRIFPAIWRPDGEGGPMDKGAGMKRNTDIIKESTAILSFWDGESRGTMDSMNKAIMFKKYMRIVYTDMPKKEARGPIHGFQSQDRWLSNMWPVEFVINGVKFASVENAYQASKLFGQRELVEKFARMPALEAKREIKKLDITTPGFHDKKLRFMKMFLVKKFQEPHLREKLFLTGNVHIEETNDWGDTFFGCCPQGIGQNYLGRLIMEVREEIRKERSAKTQTDILQ